jgi:ribonuclease P protein component
VFRRSGWSPGGEAGAEGWPDGARAEAAARLAGVGPAGRVRGRGLSVRGVTGIQPMGAAGSARPEGLGREERIRRRADFEKAYAGGQRARGRFLTVIVRPNNLPVARLGVAASKKLGGAVYRNRAKRLLREVFRRNKPAPGYDIVVIPRRELLDAELSSLEADYRAALRRRLRTAG